jgi:predicted helicase
MPSHREALRGIRTFPQLIKFLRDEMDWPIESDDFEELTFDYTPEELGIDTAVAAKIEKNGIKRLRPLTANQPWGIFFVKFEPKRLPVVALRRVLSRVVLKKRASANSADRAAWQADDLLFISNYGEGDDRQISFAHFSTHADKADLPTLMVLGWDSDNTALHLDEVADKLTTKLSWPQHLEDVTHWREQWRAAFTLRHREVITTSKALAERLADLARSIRQRVNAVLKIESDKGPLRRLHRAFRDALIHDLTEDDFADMYAQTIAYGLLTARVSRPSGLVAENLSDMVPVTNPFLKDLLASFLSAGGRKGKVDFDELGISEVVELLRDANMEAVLRDFGDRNPEEDPAIHFYQYFLQEYDPEKRMQRGVFYTPRPVVSYIVRSVHELLQTKFGLEDGLASTVTWGEMTKRHGDLDIPAGVAPDSSFVQVLDPATGTATFLVEVIDLIHRTLTSKWRAQSLTESQQRVAWNDYVPKYLLPRVYGYELMMAPYAIAHMKIGLKLSETGYRFASNERARIYLTNALEPASDDKKQREFEEWAPALAHEAIAVNIVKRHQPISVVIGNPPYSLLSANMETHHRALVETYKFVDHERIRERGALQLEKNLNDDYVKFVRLTQLVVERSGVGVTGLITNHSFLDNPTMRGMRWSLLNSASYIWLIDLHGNATKKEQPPAGGEDVNVFQIKQGVAISLSSRLPGKGAACEARYQELWGTRQTKEAWLAANQVGSHEWRRLEPTPALFLFVPQSGSLKSEFESWPTLPDAMPTNGAGYITARDNLVIDFDSSLLVDRIRTFNSSRLDDDALLKAYEVADKKGWDVRRARAQLKRVNIPKSVIETNYRPFDSRWIFFDSTLVWGRSWPTLQHIVGCPRNLTMLATRMTKDQWDVWASRTVSSHKAMSAYDTNSIFPLYLVEDSESPQRSLSSEHRINFSAPFLRSLAKALALPQKGEHGLPIGLTPEDIFQYAYATFHSPSYRSRYAEFLKSDFPRLPLTEKLDLFRSLGKLGNELLALHLLESPKLDRQITEFIGGQNPEVEKVSWSQNTVWVDKARTIGFRGVREEVWNFHVGGYQVCDKWLKDRRGRTLRKKDTAHYGKMVVAVTETIRVMAEIDKVINAHGGWPSAFSVAKS